MQGQDFLAKSPSALTLGLSYLETVVRVRKSYEPCNRNQLQTWIELAWIQVYFHVVFSSFTEGRI